MCRCAPGEAPEIKSWGEQCTNLYDGECGADCHMCKKATFVDGTVECKCYANETRQVIWGEDLCTDPKADKCGDRCQECRFSWEESDPKASVGDTAMCRCRNWKDI